MRLRGFTRLALAAAAISILLLTGCSTYSSGTRDSSGATVSCAEVLSSIVERIRSEETSGAIDSEFDYLSGNCSAEHGIATDYASTRGQSCESVSEFISAEALALLTEEGSCASSGVAAPSEADGSAGPPSLRESQPGGGITWDEAVDYAGTVQRVCGPYAGQGSSEDDVFVNLGLDYPDPGRFQIVVWDVGTLDPIPVGSTICTTGVIGLYKGVAEIELQNPAEILIYP